MTQGPLAYNTYNLLQKKCNIGKLKFLLEKSVFLHQLYMKGLVEILHAKIGRGWWKYCMQKLASTNSHCCIFFQWNMPVKAIRVWEGRASRDAALLLVLVRVVGPGRLVRSVSRNFFQLPALIRQLQYFCLPTAGEDYGYSPLSMF